MMKIDDAFMGKMFLCLVNRKAISATWLKSRISGYAIVFFHYTKTSSCNFKFLHVWVVLIHFLANYYITKA